MKKSQITLIVIAAGAFLMGAFLLSTYNTLVGDEEGIRAQEKQIDLAIDKMVKKIQGSGKTVSNFKETLKEVLASTIGEGGRAANASAVFSAVAERYPEVPQDLWRDLAATMNAEYESFASSQSSKVAKIEAFRKRLRDPAYKPAKYLGGFPTISLEDADKLIVGSKARESRESGTIETIDPFAEEKSEKN